MKSDAEVFPVRGVKTVSVWTRPEPGDGLAGPWGGPSGRFPAVLFLHGFPGSQQNWDLRHALLKKGVATLAPHFHGAWGSDGLYRFSTLVPQARAALRFMASRPGVDRGRLAVFGFSMGGWTAIHLGAIEPRLSGVAAVAPVGGPEMVREGTEARIMDLGRPVRAGSPRVLARDFVASVRRWDPAESASRLKTPLLLVHGRGDEIVHHGVSERIASRCASPCRLVLEPGARHDFLDRREKLVRLVTSWLLKRLRG